MLATFEVLQPPGVRNSITLPKQCRKYVPHTSIPSYLLSFDGAWPSFTLVQSWSVKGSQESLMVVERVLLENDG